MDAPAPDNIAAEEGGQQQQMHHDEKEHRPMLRRVKDKLKKMKNTIAGHGHDHDHDHEQDTGGGDSNSTGEDEEDAATREAEVEKSGYQQQDVEDKPIFADSSPEQHGAPSKVKHNDAPGVRLGDLGATAATQEVKRDDAPGVRLGDLGATAAAQEVKRDDAAGMRLGDLGGPASAKEVKRDDAPGVRPGDLGALAAAQEVKRDDAAGMLLGDLGGPASAKEVKLDDTQGVPLGDLGSPVVEDPAVPNSRTPMPRGGQDIGTTDAVRNFEAMTVSDDPKQVGAGKMDVDVSKEYEAMPVSDGTGEEWNDAPTDADVVAGVGTVVASKAQQVTPGFGAGGNAQDDSSATAAPESVTAGAGKRDLDLPQEGTRASYTGTEGLKNAATGATGTEGLKNAATDATTEGAPGATYTDMIKSAAAGTTEYGKKLASTVYDMIKSAVAGTTEYGKKLASTVYEKVAGVGTAPQVTTSAGTATTWATATPGVGAQDGATTRATVTPGAGGPGNGQDKGVTAYIAEKVRSLSEAITGAVQQRKEGVGSTVARARGAVTSLTGVSETVQPTTEGNIGEGVSVLHGAAPRTNTNVM